MHNIKDIRLNSENFINLLKGRNSDIDINELLLLDKSNRDLIKKKELLEQEKKKISKTKDQSLFKKSINLSKQIDELEIKNNEFTKFPKYKKTLFFESFFCKSKI